MEVGKDGPLAYWKINGVRFPLLQKLAKRLLSVPASSTASERIFSKAGSILTKKRMTLKPQWVHKILYVHENLMFRDLIKQKKVQTIE